VVLKDQKDHKAKRDRRVKEGSLALLDRWDRRAPQDRKATKDRRVTQGLKVIRVRLVKRVHAAFQALLDCASLRAKRRLLVTKMKCWFRLSVRRVQPMGLAAQQQARQLVYVCASR
jgi:hypothetical protein